MASFKFLKNPVGLGPEAITIFLAYSWSFKLPTCFLTQNFAELE